MYDLQVLPHADRIFFKLAKKNRWLLMEARKKILQIREDPHRFKYLHAKMRGLFRAHVAGSFVIVFDVDESSKTVIIHDFDHHDRIYR